MAATHKAAAQSVLDRMAVPELERVYALGSFSSPVTFSSQQFRAFNLIWALFETGLLAPGDSLAVVGGGLAGVTAAAAAALKRCKVTLIERANQLFHLQRGNFVRYVHPNILRWPQDGSEVKYTTFPTLNWSHGTVNEIIGTVEAQWNAISSAVELLLGYEVDSVGSTSKLAWLRANRLVGNGPTLHMADYSSVILAVGFGYERGLENAPFRYYWENDSLHQSVRPDSVPRRFLVSGCGDGGLVETLRLRLLKFDHRTFVSDVLRSKVKKDLRNALLELEDTAAGKSAPVFYASYKKLPVSNGLIAAVRNGLRTDTEVTLNSPGVSPLSPQSSALNRFLAFLLLEYGDLRYEEGRISVSPIVGGGFEVSFKKTSGKQSSRRFDEVVIRHGAKGIINDLLSDAAVEKLASLNRKSPDPTTQKLWSDQFYPPVSGQVVASHETLRSALRSFEQAFSSLYDATSTDAIGISPSAEKPNFLVLLKPGCAPKSASPDSVAGFRVIYHEGRGLPLQVAGITTQISRLHIGSGIINFDEHTRRGGGAITAPATLGCFVKLASGETGFLSTGQSLAATADSGIGDHIAVVRSGEASIVGTLRMILGPLARVQSSEPNLVDVALVALEGNVDFRPLFGDAIHGRRLTGCAEPRPGDDVFKVGCRSGMTLGHIIAKSASMFVTYGENQYLFEDVIAISGRERFSVLGDTGALIVRRDGKALGILFAGSEALTFAFRLRPALEQLGCILITDESTAQSRNEPPP